MAQKKDDDERPQKPPENKDSDGSNDSSMMNRVQSSASGLLRNALAGTGGNDLNADLSNSLSSTGKASSSQTSRTASSATESSHLTSNAPAVSRDGEQNLRSESFRSGLTTQEDGLDNNQLGETHGDDLLYDLSNTKGKGTSSGEQTTSQQPDIPLNTKDLSTFNTAWTAPTSQPDGSDVVALLSSPTFQPDTIPSPIEQEEQEQPTLTPSELELIDSFRRHPSMPATSTLHTPNPINPLSLIPDISSAEQQTESHLQTLPGISDWIDLDKNYHAEVWGYLRPHIRAAMDEIEERSSRGKEEGGGETKDGPAVRRLQMILRHMRGV